MKKFLLLCLLTICSNSFCMDNLRLDFVRSTCPMMIERFRAFDINISQALISTESLVGEKRIVEDILRFFAKNREAVEEDSCLLASICEYTICAGKVFAEESTKVSKLQDLVIAMLAKMTKSGSASVAFQNFYKLFSGSYHWILNKKDEKFAVYATLARASVAGYLSRYDVDVMSNLSHSCDNLDSSIKILITEIEKLAPFLVGACDMRGEQESMVLEVDLKSRILNGLKTSLAKEVTAEGTVQEKFKEITSGL